MDDTAASAGRVRRPRRGLATAVARIGGARRPLAVTPAPGQRLGRRPRLSVCTMTYNSGARLERWLERALEYADELLVYVDAASDEPTLEVARRYADRVQRFEHPSHMEEVLDTLMHRATGEWVLRLDDDEFVSSDLVRSLPRLLDDNALTHYILHCRWVVLGEQTGTYRWLRCYPWYPDLKFRLFRNVRSLFTHPPQLHSSTTVIGEGRVLDEDEGVIYHMDLAWRTRAQREAKVRQRYVGRSVRSHQEYYLYEDYEPGVTYAQVPPDEVERRADAAALQRAQQRAARFAGGANYDPAVIPRASLAPVEERFMVRWGGHTLPPVVEANRGYTVELEVENTGTRTWRCSGDRLGQVFVSYHWDNADGRVVNDGDRSMLPHDVHPGDTVRVVAGVWTPYEPGRYHLVWDMVSEGRHWFSEVTGGSVQRVPVEVKPPPARLIDWLR